MMRSLLLSFGFVSVCTLALRAHAVDFLREVQPIFAEHCAECHGVDAKSRAAEYRLDIDEMALRGGESGKPAIVPGKPDESELVRRILSQDADTLMPPPEHNKPLSAKQIETLRLWITEGAKFEKHWSFVVPRKESLPGEGTANPVDAFVASNLQAKA